ncbi:hypothetical protein L3Y34_009462 [Caenorhabditis briggsae]|uniref:F-box domain-containing protein n=1 Tax=Caenorhabditis briggsae TaxID=6238 RepID=A0AAE9D2G7_CAEBR|nr:hypothetical protein L3Y34_009462 [Caenorhabditis briggsae]
MMFLHNFLTWLETAFDREYSDETCCCKPLKFLGLPQNVFENILRQMDFISVFDLSLLSKEMRLKIKQINFQLDCLEINNFGSKNWIKFRNYSEEVPAMTFNFDTDYYDWGWKIKIGEKNVEMRSQDNSRFLKAADEGFTGNTLAEVVFIQPTITTVKLRTLNLTSRIFWITSLVFSILNPDSLLLNWIASHRNFENSYPIFNNRLVLQLSGVLYSYTGLDSLIQGNYDGLEGFVADFEFGNRFDYREILKLKRCSFNYARFFTRQDLVNLEFENLRIQKHRLTGDVVNAFIKSWLAGNHKNLQHLGVSKIFGLEEMEDNSIRTTNTIDCRQGLDVQRVDGTIGTMMFKNDHFLFLVWKIPFVGRIDQ